MHALPDEAYTRLQAWLEPTVLERGVVISPPDTRASHAWFPTSAIISLQQDLDGKAGSEVALIGRDGLCGMSIVVGDGSSSRRATVQCSGNAYRLPAQVLLEEFEATPALRASLLRYFQAQMAQVAQNAACYRLHSVEQQVCRRMLMLLDRLPALEIPVTHEMLATALGVRREAVTLACARLLAEGIIQPGRGRIRVLDRPRLETHACECHLSLQREVARLSPAALPGASVASKGFVQAGGSILTTPPG
ncbi:MAG: Crp/Fnr family transcriptional regulator [Gammaproteobacteria bacterium]|nr:Crp/Fnr family transcriptional regulator [Gammaproteobacteria bacterium]